MSASSARLGAKAIEVVRFVKAQLSSSMATGADWVVVTILIQLHVYYVHAVIYGAVAGAITDFSIKKWWVFKTGLQHGQSEAIRYALVSGSSALLNGGIVYACCDGLGMSKPIGVVVTSLFVGFVWNYPMHRLFVFSTTAAPARTEQ